jgi:hypothetical protein
MKKMTKKITIADTRKKYRLGVGDLVIYTAKIGPAENSWLGIILKVGPEGFVLYWRWGKGRWQKNALHWRGLATNSVWEKSTIIHAGETS